jgi:S-DNA-T family DNA segregation ATPase FtsK/SpoIIIE
MTWQASDTILGAGSYKAGYDASKFLRSHKGVGILLGADDEAATDEPVTVRTDLLNSVDVRAICERGRQLRIAAGTLEGDAAGDTDVPDDSPSDPADVDVLALVRDVFGDAEELRSVEVCERLKAAGLDVGPQQLAALLAPFQVFPADIRFGQPSRPLKGYRVADICRALERRDQGATDPDVP